MGRSFIDDINIQQNVSDFAGLIEPGYEQKIDNIIVDIEARTTAEVAVITLDTLEGMSIDDAAYKLFNEFGEVVYAKVITRPDGRSKGFGFVEMAEEDQAQAAIEKLNQSEFMERTMVVNEAREMEKRPPRTDNDRGGYRKRDAGGSNDLNYKLRQLRRKFK